MAVAGRCGWITRIDPAQRTEQGGNVGHAASHRTGGVLAVGDGNNPGAADQAQGGFQADDPVDGGRADDRAVGFGADSNRAEVRGNRHRRA